MFKRALLDLEPLLKLEDKFLHFSHISGKDIQQIWSTTKEKLNEEQFEKLEYHWNAPLWTKMFFRWKNEGYSAINLWSDCDPNNRQRLLNYFKLGNEWQYVEFFHWMRNSLSVVDIVHLEKGKIDDVKELETSDHAKLWKNNEIVYFYFLSQNKQEALIFRYNEEVIKPFLAEPLELNSDHLWMFGKEYDHYQ